MEKLVRSMAMHWIGLAVDFGLATALAVYAIRIMVAAPLSPFVGVLFALLFVAVGRVCYVLFEYVVHRWLLDEHAVPLVTIAHDMHHDEPAPIAAFPYFFIAPMCITLYGWLLWLALPDFAGQLEDAAVALAMATASASFGWFGLLHRWMHGRRPLRNRYLRALQVHHLQHHSKDGHEFSSITVRWPDRAVNWIEAQWRKRTARA
jgi:hypothetical protein